MDGEDAIFFSLHTAQISGRLRKYLIILLDEKYTKAITDENWSRIWKIIEHLENSLKADIGIFDLPVIGASPYHEDDVLLLDEIDREIRALTGSDLSAGRHTVIQEKQLFTVESDSLHNIAVPRRMRYIRSLINKAFRTHSVSHPIRNRYRTSRKLSQKNFLKQFLKVFQLPTRH